MMQYKAIALNDLVVNCIAPPNLFANDSLLNMEIDVLSKKKKV